MQVPKYIERIAAGRTDLVFSLLADGGSSAVRDGNGTPVIRWCAYYGDVSAVRALVDSGESLASLGENLDLNGAVFHGHWRLVQFLVEAGADVNHSQPETLERPLHAAFTKRANGRSDRVVDVLLSHGAEVNVRTRAGAETGSFMRDVRTRGEMPLHRAAAFGSLRSIRKLIAAGAKVDARDANGDSPLTWASWHLRSAAVLDALCFGEHMIHADAVAASRDTESGDSEARALGLESYLLGEPL